MDFIDHKLLTYAEEHSDNESALLKELNRETYSKVLYSRMLSGHLQGRCLAMFSNMIQPNSILEIGTYTGYSALCLAEGLTKDGKLITIDINDELADMVKQYIDRSTYKGQIEAICGDAIKIIPQLNLKFDLVFIDADKQNYNNYYDLVFDKVNTGGYIIADNVLWSGHVIEDEENFDDDTKHIHEFNKKVKQDERVSKVLMPIRDGLLVIRKNKVV